MVLQQEPIAASAAGTPPETAVRATVRTDPEQLELQPGGEAEFVVYIRHLGGVVDQFQLRVEGIDASWISPRIERVTLFPGDEGKLAFTLRLPTDHALVAAGQRPFKVRAVSRNDA